jgi:hypothetical protein
MNIQKIIDSSLDSEAYGCNLIIKQYSRFPKYLPLPCHTEHGWTPIDHALVTDLEIAKRKKLMLVYSHRREAAWKKASDIPVRIIGAPFILYRHLHNIKRRPEAVGTVAFPSHSTIFLESKFDADSYCKKLLQLPKEFHPISICLLYPDIKRGRDKIYEKYGFKVVSAGKKLRGSLDFVKKFYTILSGCKYTTSNDIGTYTFYSVEMGTPFFLYGDEPITVNPLNIDKNIGKQAKMSDFGLGKEAMRIFNTGPTKIITSAQKNYVSRELGVKDAIPPEKLRQTFFATANNLDYWLSRVPKYYLMSLIRLLIPDSFAYWVFERAMKAKSKSKSEA